MSRTILAFFELLFSSEAKETPRRLLWESFNQLARDNQDFCVGDLGLRVDEFRDFELQVDRVSKIPQI